MGNNSIDSSELGAIVFALAGTTLLAIATCCDLRRNGRAYNCCGIFSPEAVYPDSGSSTAEGGSESVHRSERRFSYASSNCSIGQHSVMSKYCAGAPRTDLPESWESSEDGNSGCDPARNLNSVDKERARVWRNLLSFCDFWADRVDNSRLSSTLTGGRSDSELLNELANRDADERAWDSSRWTSCTADNSDLTRITRDRRSLLQSPFVEQGSPPGSPPLRHVQALALEYRGSGFRHFVL